MPALQGEHQSPLVPYRVGTDIQWIPKDLIDQHHRSVRMGFERRTPVDVTLDDLDLELARRTLARTPAGSLPVKDALDHYGLIERDEGRWRVTNAARLLFCRIPAQQHPLAGVRVFRVHGRERLFGSRRNVVPMRRAEPYPPMVLALEEAMRLAGAQLHSEDTASGSPGPDGPQIPDFAWREALVNAVAHRDYAVETSETEMWIYDDRVEVSSPGELLPPATLARLRQGKPAHSTRNPLIFRVLSDIGAARGRGGGIARMVSHAARRGLRPPKIDARYGIFTITLFCEAAHAPQEPS